MISAQHLPAAIVAVFLTLVAPAGWAQQANVAKPAPAATSRVNSAFTAWDSDKNGVLSRSEFDAGWAVLREGAAAEQRLRVQFHKVDANGNGTIDAGEYPNLLLVKNAGAAALPLSAFDTNKNQRLEFGEYVSLVRRMATRGPAVAPAKKLP